MKRSVRDALAFPNIRVTLGKIFIYINPFYLFLDSQWQSIELDNSIFIDK
jgi:hypothetical protein